MSRPPGLEVHEHTYLSGPHARFSPSKRLVHSHDGGDRPHQHPQTGPASYTIDKDEWFRLTGLRGGGRKTFTRAPTGEQLPVVALTDEQQSFEIIVGKPPEEDIGEGPGLAPAARMVLGFGMTIATIRSFDDWKTGARGRDAEPASGMARRPQKRRSSGRPTRGRRTRR